MDVAGATRNNAAMTGMPQDRAASQQAEFAEHGRYALRRRGRVIEVDVHDAWNYECMRRFAEDLKRAAAPLLPAPWAVLCDLRQWQLTVPEADSINEELQLWSRENGQRWRAYVMPDSLLVADRIEEYSQPIAGDIEERSFATPAEARGWLQSLALYAADPSAPEGGDR